jgi:hypothetical protein
MVMVAILWIQWVWGRNHAMLKLQRPHLLSIALAWMSVTCFYSTDYRSEWNINASNGRLNEFVRTKRTDPFLEQLHSKGKRNEERHENQFTRFMRNIIIPSSCRKIGFCGLELRAHNTIRDLRHLSLEIGGHFSAPAKRRQGLSLDDTTENVRSALRTFGSTLQIVFMSSIECSSLKRDATLWFCKYRSRRSRHFCVSSFLFQFLLWDARWCSFLMFLWFLMLQVHHNPSKATLCLLIVLKAKRSTQASTF